MEDEGRFDNLFANVATAANGIEPLLDLFFGFLQRKTDFFVAPQQDPEKIESLVLKYCRKYQKRAEGRRKAVAAEHRAKDEARLRRAAAANRAEEQHRQSVQSSKPPQEKKPQAKVEEIFEDEAADTSQNSTASTLSGNVTTTEPTASVVPGAAAADSDDKKAKRDKKTADSGSHTADADVDDAEDDDDDDDESSPAKHGNGGVTDKYTWTQTLATVEVFIEVPPNTKSSNCDIQMTATALKAGLKGQQSIVDGKLCQKIKVDESCWTLLDNKTVHLTLEKLDGMRWWECVVKGDPTINTKKIVPENSKLGDLDGETRATVEKMMFDQKQKELGLPTSSQRKDAALLENFKKAHPEMDFSKAKINYGGGSSGGFDFQS